LKANMAIKHKKKVGFRNEKQKKRKTRNEKPETPSNF